ncbi:hypothetical protein DFS34DRAFT_589760 [Phlyctochytrium arcticum]|nr:hypothetical protein DFS34DRAFT_589760 [Phlyctochytrium arcticum]
MIRNAVRTTGIGGDSSCLQCLARSLRLEIRSSNTRRTRISLATPFSTATASYARASAKRDTQNPSSKNIELPTLNLNSEEVPASPTTVTINKPKRSLKIFAASIKPESSDLVLKRSEWRSNSKKWDSERERPFRGTNAGRDGRREDIDKQPDEYLPSRREVRPPDTFGFERALSASDRVGAWLKFNDIIYDQSERRKLTEAQCLQLLRLLVKHRPPKIDSIKEVLAVMRQLGLQVTTDSYNVLIEAYARQGDVAGSRIALGHLVEEGLKPDLRTYNLYMQMYVRGNNLPSTIKFFDRMTEEGVVPDAETYNILLRGCGHEKLFERAEKYFEEMKAQGIEANVRTYNILIGMFTRSGDLPAAEKWYEELKRSGLQPDTHVYATLMSGYARTADVERVTAYFDEMVSAGLTPDLVTYTNLLQAKAKGGDVEGALATVEDIKKAGLALDLVAYQTLIEMFCKHDKVAAAEDFLVEMRRERVRIQPSLYRTIISAYAAANQPADAARVLEQMQLNGIPANEAMYNLILESASKAFDTEIFETYWHHIKYGAADEVQPNSRTYAIVLAHYVLVSDAVHATRAFHTMCDQKFIPSEEIVQSLIECNMRTRRWEAAAAVLSRARQVIPAQPSGAPLPSPSHSSSKDHGQAVTDAIATPFHAHRVEFEKLIESLGSEVSALPTAVTADEKKIISGKCNLITALYQVLTNGTELANEAIYRHAIEAYRRQGEPLNAVRVFTDLMVHQENKRIEMQAPTVTAVLICALEFKLDKFGRHLVTFIEKGTFKVDKPGYVAYLELLVRYSLPRKIITAMVEMSSVGLKPDAATYSAVVRRFKKEQSTLKAGKRDASIRAEKEVHAFVEEQFPELLEGLEKELEEQEDEEREQAELRRIAGNKHF